MDLITHYRSSRLTLRQNPRVRKKSSKAVWHFNTCVCEASSCAPEEEEEKKVKSNLYRRKQNRSCSHPIDMTRLLVIRQQHPPKRPRPLPQPHRLVSRFRGRRKSVDWMKRASVIRVDEVERIDQRDGRLFALEDR